MRCTPLPEDEEVLEGIVKDGFELQHIGIAYEGSMTYDVYVAVNDGVLNVLMIRCIPEATGRAGAASLPGQGPS